MYKVCDNVDAVKKPFKWFKDYQMKGNIDKCHLLSTKFKLEIH